MSGPKVFRVLFAGVALPLIAGTAAFGTRARPAPQVVSTAAGLTSSSGPGGLARVAALAKVVREPGSPTPSPRTRKWSKPIRAWSLRLPKRRLVDAVLGPASSGRQVFLLTSEEDPELTAIVCVELSSGRPLWSRAAGQIRAMSADDQRLYVLSNEGEGQGLVRAFRWAGGQAAWSKTANWLGGSEMVTDGQSLLWSEGEAGAIMAVDARNARVRRRLTGTPLALVKGRAYIHRWGSGAMDDGQYLARVNPLTGREERNIRYNETIATSYDLTDFTWSASSQRFFGVEQLRGYAIGVRALKPDLSPAWFQPDAGPYALCGNTLVSQQYQRYGSMTVGEVRTAGLLALDAATGARRWARPDQLGVLVGATPEEVVVGNVASPNKLGVLYRGLRSTDGRERWATRLPLVGARVVHRWLIGSLPLLKEYPAGKERIVCYRLP